MRTSKAAATIAARLTFDHVGHVYETTPALTSISLDVAAGEVVCLLGPSGCGKTTLLRIAAGLERQTAGRVCINGKEIAGPTLFMPPEKRGIGLMFQDYALFPHLSIVENVTFGLTRLTREEAIQEARRTLDRVGLSERADHYPHALSGGEQQRAALARAIAPRPGALLMDEPFSGLDRRLRDSVRDETLAILRETGATALIVTHDPEEAMRMADRIALMRAGRIVQIDAPRALYEKPADLFAARFFSELNEVPGRAAAEGVRSAIGLFPLPDGARPGAEMTLCVRPQHVRLSRSGDGVPGRVTSRRFLGEVDHLDIAVEGLDRPLKARMREIGAFAPGRDVGLHVAPGDVLIFPK